MNIVYTFATSHHTVNLRGLLSRDSVVLFSGLSMRYNTGHSYLTPGKLDKHQAGQTLIAAPCVSIKLMVLASTVNSINWPMPMTEPCYANFVQYTHERKDFLCRCFIVRPRFVITVRTTHIRTEAFENVKWNISATRQSYLIICPVIHLEFGGLQVI